MFVLTFGMLVAARAATPKTSYNLPSDLAERSLKRLSEQSGHEVLFPTEAVAGVRTNSVKGEMTARQALDAMLRGTVLVAVEGKKTATLSVRRVPADEKNNGEPPSQVPPNNEPPGAVKKKNLDPRPAHP